MAISGRPPSWLEEKVVAPDNGFQLPVRGRAATYSHEQIHLTNTNYRRPAIECSIDEAPSLMYYVKDITAKFAAGLHFPSNRARPQPRLGVFSEEDRHAKKIGLGGIIFMLLILSTFAVASTAETKTIRSDGVPVELDNLWGVTPTVEVSIAANLQLTVTGLDTWTDPPADRQPNTLGFYIYYPEFPEYTYSCFLTPQPYLTTLPTGHVTQEADGSFTLTFNLSELEQNSCPHTLQYYIDNGPFDSRVEVSDNYGNPVLYSEPFIADLAPETPICRYIVPIDGIDQATEEIYALDLDSGTTDTLVEKLSEVEDKLSQNPPDLHDARSKVFSFVGELEAAVDAGALTTEEANNLLNLAGGILASITF